MEEKRSKGITLLGWFLIITSVTGILFNLYLIIFLKDSLAKYTHLYKLNSELFYRITSIIGIPVSGLKLILGVNILKLKEKWRKITFYYFFFDIIFLFTSIFFFIDFFHGLRAQAGPIALSGFLMYFITRPKIKEQFKSA